MGFKMTFRWFGPKDDNIPLKYIRQIPGIYGVVTALFDIPVGEVWPEGKIFELKRWWRMQGSNLR